MPTSKDATFICPVCRYPGLSEPPYDANGASSFDICPCCGTQFGYQDARTPHSELRKRWLDSGAHWHSKVVAQPENWNALDQLRLAGLDAG